MCLVGHFTPEEKGLEKQHYTSKADHIITIHTDLFYVPLIYKHVKVLFRMPKHSYHMQCNSKAYYNKELYFSKMDENDDQNILQINKTKSFVCRFAGCLHSQK